MGNRQINYSEHHHDIYEDLIVVQEFGLAQDGQA